MTPKTAMILSAGLGKRMLPLTETKPKVLVDVNGRPLIDWAIDRLAEAGVNRIIVNLHHFADQVRVHLDQRDDLEIVFSPEPDLLETGGGIRAALPLLGDEPFYAVNGDAICLNGPTSALGRMAAAWSDDQMDVLLLLNSTVEAVGYNGQGDFMCESCGQLSRRPECEVSPYVYTGVQIVHPRAFEGTSEGPFSMNTVFDACLENERLYGIIHDGLWLHVGTPDGVKEAEAALGERFLDLRRR